MKTEKEIKKNNTDFPFFLKKKIKKIEKTFDEKYNILKHYQYIIYKYITNINNNNLRGLLLFMETGYGKTLTAISIANFFIKNSNKKVIILLAKGLIDNFKDNIQKYINFTEKDNNVDLEKYIDENYKFISLNSNKMFKNLTKESEDNDLENKLKLIINSDNMNNLENSVLIVDEAHNLFNSITNGSKNATKLYDRIMNTKNIKLLFLTGTPMINYPFEIVPCMNMLMGKIKIPKTKITSTLFPEDEDDFNNFFVNMKNNSLKNNNILTNRMIGLVSYYGTKFNKKIEKEIHDPMFPKQFKLEEIICPMSDYQYTIYLEARRLEVNENSRNFSTNNFEKKKKFREKSSSDNKSYRIRSRQTSNFCLPENAIKKSSKKNFYIKNLNKVDIDDYTKNLKKYSPKMLKLIENLEKYPKTELSVIYSTFVSIEGIELIKRVLLKKGYKQYKIKKEDTKEIENYYGKINSHDENNNSDNKDKDKKNFAIISGKVDVKDRKKIIDKFTHKENLYGKYINILIFSNTGVEGLDLKNVRHVHIFEPFWNYARIIQVIARAVRYKSHILLPPEKRTVKSYIYLSSHPKNINIKKMMEKKNYFLKKGYFVEEKTTDLYIFDESKRHFKLIREMEYVLAQSSIDCNVHSSNTIVKCKMCNPTNKKLFSDSLNSADLLYDPCKEIEEKEVDAKEIKINDKIFYYVDDENSPDIPDIYEEDEISENYIKIKDKHPLYKKILEKINNMNSITGGKKYHINSDFMMDEWLKRI